MQLHFIIRKVTVKVFILNCIVLAKIYPAGGGQISPAIFIDAGTHHVVVVVLPIVHEHGAAAHLGAALLLRVHLHLDLVRREGQVRGPLPAYSLKRVSTLRFVITENASVNVKS